MRRVCARNGLLFFGCIGRGCRGSLGRGRGRRERKVGVLDQGLVARPLRRRGRCGVGSLGRVRSMGETGTDGREMKRPSRRNALVVGVRWGVGRAGS